MRVWGLLAAGLLLGAVLGHAQEAPLSAKPDVPFVPTNYASVEAMLRLANVRADDYLIDLGSGDGRILITAARRYGARGYGVDIDPQRIRDSRQNARAAGVEDRVEFHQRNLFTTPLRDATVVTLYLLPRINLQLRPRLLSELKPGTRVVSHDFDMGEWKPDVRATVRGAGSEVFLWIVPARVAGRWRIEIPVAGASQYEVVFKQDYQEIDTAAWQDGSAVAVREDYLEGDRVTFLVVSPADFLHRWRFEGRVAGDTMAGTVRGEGTAPRVRYNWRAVRTEPGAVRSQ